MDSAGPIGKTPYDIPAFSILSEDDTLGYPADGYTRVLHSSIGEFSVATINYRK